MGRKIVHKGPWKVTASKIVYKNHWMTVREDKVIRPDGKNGIFGIVQINEGVAVLPIDHDFNIYLTREYHYAVETENLEAVAGGIENDETKEKAARRELLEEVGIAANKLTYLGVTLALTTMVNIKGHLFIAQDLSFTQAAPEGTEIIELVKLPFNKALEMIKSGEICDSTTVVLILRTKEYLDIN